MGLLRGVNESIRAQGQTQYLAHSRHSMSDKDRAITIVIIAIAACSLVHSPFASKPLRPYGLPGHTHTSELGRHHSQVAQPLCATPFLPTTGS